MATRTARQIIVSALRRIAILSEEESPIAAQAVDALAVLNDLMQGFPTMGIPYVHETLTLDSVLNVPDEQTRNVMLMLVWELADGYGKTLSQKILTDIQVDSALSNPLLSGTASITRA
jgi:hypothetical protein